MIFPASRLSPRAGDFRAGFDALELLEKQGKLLDATKRAPEAGGRTVGSDGCMALRWCSIIVA